MQTTDNGISFSLVKRPIEKGNTNKNHDHGAAGSSKAQQAGQVFTKNKDEQPKIVQSDQKKGKARHHNVTNATEENSQHFDKDKALQESLNETSTTESASKRKKKSRKPNKPSSKSVNTQASNEDTASNGAITAPFERLNETRAKENVSKPKGRSVKQNSPNHIDKLDQKAATYEHSNQAEATDGASHSKVLERAPKNNPSQRKGNGSSSNASIEYQNQQVTDKKPKSSSERRYKKGDAMNNPRDRKIRASHAKGESVKEGVRALYRHHYSLEQVEKGLEAKTLYQGTLRINKKNRAESYVTVLGIDEDIFIQGVVARNRALNGDVVIVELLQEDERLRELQKLKKSREEKLEKEQERMDKVAIPDEDISLEDVVASDLEDDVEDVIMREDKVDSICFGRVVYIMSRTFNHNVAGTLQIENFGLQDPKKIWFKPVDKRIPFFVISRELAPKEFLERPEDFSRTFFTASIITWSAHSRLPLAEVTGKLGQMGELPTETQALLADAGVTWSDFDDSVLDDLPATPWEIPSAEVKIRRDFRGDHVFSIDPLTAKDLDDAISVKQLDNGLLEVGVHIADVSHFVEPGTNLDKEAHFRASTVYLVQRAIPMLPRLLCEQLCSLNPDVDRLAFSVVWIMNTNAEIIGEPWFGKSIIRSRAKLAYEHAQAIIEGRDWSSLPTVNMSKDTTFDKIREDVLLFYGLSKNLRKRRYENGALSIQSIKLWFSLDDLGNPIKTGIYQIKDSNRLIEEFMLLANMAVAHKISSVFPEASLLRCHPPPLQKGMDKFLELASKVGYEFDVSSSKALHESFERIQDPIIRHIWRLLSIKVMKRAVYFNTGTQELTGFRHYALSVPLYTHFTSPIRRYADLVVHRMLHAILNEKENPYASADVAEIAKQCNIRKETAKVAQDASMNLYLVSLLQNLSKVEDLCEFAIVTEVGSRSIDVIVPRFGIEKRVWIEDLVADNLAIGCQLDSKTMTLKVHWRKTTNSITSISSQLEGMKLEDQNKDEVVIVEDDNDDDWEDVNEDEKVENIKVQQIRMFDTIKVRINPLLERSPPTLQLILIYPTETYSTHEIFAVVEDIFHYKSKDEYNLIQSAASCPGMADDRD